MQNSANGVNAERPDCISSQLAARSGYFIAVLVVLTLVVHLMLPYNLTEYGAPSYLSFSAASPLIVLSALAILATSASRQKHWPVDIWLVFLVFFAIFSFQKHWENARAVIFLLLLVYCIYKSSQNRICRIIILKSMLIIAVLYSLQICFAAFQGESFFLSLLNVYDFGKYGLDAPRAGFGFTYNSVQATIVMLLGIGVVVALWKRIGVPFSILLLSLFCISMVLIGSRAGAAALAGIVVWFVIVRRLRQAAMLFATLVIAFCVVELGGSLSLFSSNSVVGKSEGSRLFAYFGMGPDDLPGAIAVERLEEPQIGRVRVEMARIALNLFIEQPIFGHGLGSFPAAASHYVESRPELMHELLRIDGTNELAADLGRLSEQPPQNFGVDADQWTLPLLHEVVARSHPEVSLDDVEHLVTTGAVQSYGELSEGLDAHSLYTSLLVETGLVGFLLFFGFLVVNGMRSSIHALVTPANEDTDFVAGMTLLLVGTAVVGLFWHIALYRETAIVVGLFLACVPMLQRSKAH